MIYAEHNYLNMLDIFRFFLIAWGPSLANSIVDSSRPLKVYTRTPLLVGIMDDASSGWGFVDECAPNEVFRWVVVQLCFLLQTYIIERVSQ